MVLSLVGILLAYQFHSSALITLVAIPFLVKEDSNINPLDPQYIIGYVYPTIVRDFDFKDSYYHYIEASYNNR